MYTFYTIRLFYVYAFSLRILGTFQMACLLLLIIFNLHFAKPIQLEFQLHSNFTKKAFWSLTKTLDFPYGEDLCVCVCVC